MCGLTACNMLFTMPALAWAADEPQNTNIDNGLIAYYDFENVNEKKVPECTKVRRNMQEHCQEIMFRLRTVHFLENL